MSKPVRLPTAGEINVFDSLDEQYAITHFLGKDLRQAEALFRENFVYYQEDLMFMGPKAFCFSVEAALNYLLCPEPRGDCLELYGFCSVIESRLDDDIEAAKPLIRQGIIKLLEQYDRFDCEDFVVGNVSAHLEALVPRL